MGKKRLNLPQDHERLNTHMITSTWHSNRTHSVKEEDFGGKDPISQRKGVGLVTFKGRSPKGDIKGGEGKK